MVEKFICAKKGNNGYNILRDNKFVMTYPDVVQYEEYGAQHIRSIMLEGYDDSQSAGHIRVVDPNDQYHSLTHDEALYLFRSGLACFYVASDSCWYKPVNMVTVGNDVYWETIALASDTASVTTNANVRKRWIICSKY